MGRGAATGKKRVQNSAQKLRREPLEKRDFAELRPWFHIRFTRHRLVCGRVRRFATFRRRPTAEPSLMPGSRIADTSSIMITSVRFQKRVHRSAASIALVLLGLAGIAQVRASDAAAVEPSWAEGWFAEFSAGAGIVPGGDITLGGVRYEAKYNTGSILQGALGRAWTPQFSTKLEWFYRSNSVKSLVAGNALINSGDLASTNAFVTATYRLGPGFEVWGIAPYAGLGAGILQEVDLDLEGFGGEEFSARNRFAYQWLIGLERAVGTKGRIFIEGRAVAAGSQDLTSSTRGRKLSVDYDTWGIIAGLRWLF